MIWFYRQRYLSYKITYANPCCFSSSYFTSSFLSFPPVSSLLSTLPHLLSSPLLSYLLLSSSPPLLTFTPLLFLAADAASSSWRSTSGEDDWLERPGKVLPSKNKNFSNFNNGKNSSNGIDNGTSVYHDSNFTSANAIYNTNGNNYSNDNNNYKDGRNFNDGKYSPQKLPPNPGMNSVIWFCTSYFIIW